MVWYVSHGVLSGSSTSPIPSATGSLGSWSLSKSFERTESLRPTRLRFRVPLGSDIPYELEVVR